MNQTCYNGVCSKCFAGKYIVIGIIVLVTAIYSIQYIWHVIGSLLILKGLLKWVKPFCLHCEPEKKGRK
ncbi:MAG: hypothetical protein AABW90_01000 [Nanoarchaeota archaeon]